MKISILASLIRNKLPEAVVRDDHCDVVRVSWKGQTAYAEPHEGTGFQVHVALRPIPDSSDSVPPPHLVDFAEDPIEAAARIVHWLGKIAAIDRS